jgi:hypothetical protein
VAGPAENILWGQRRQLHGLFSATCQWRAEFPGSDTAKLPNLAGWRSAVYVIGASVFRGAAPAFQGRRNGVCGCLWFVDDCRLQAEYDRIQSRIQAMYVDKLDGKVDPGMFEHLSADWRKQQDQCLREIERRQSADQHYLEEGVTILEMARNAQRLFDSEEPMEKRRLLNFVASNSAWANGELNATLREPFGLIAEMAKFTSDGGSSNGANFADHSDWLGN